MHRYTLVIQPQTRYAYSIPIGQQLERYAIAYKKGQQLETGSLTPTMSWLLGLNKYAQPITVDFATTGTPEWLPTTDGCCAKYRILQNHRVDNDRDMVQQGLHEMVQDALQEFLRAQQQRLQEQKRSRNDQAQAPRRCSSSSRCQETIKFVKETMKLKRQEDVQAQAGVKKHCKKRNAKLAPADDVSSTSNKRIHNDIIDSINMKSVKGAKKPKTAKPPKALRDIGADEPQQLPQPLPLNEKQEATLAKALTDLNANTEKLSKQLTPVQDELQKGDSAAPLSKIVSDCVTNGAALAIAEDMVDNMVIGCLRLRLRAVSSVDNMVINKMADGFKELQASIIKHTKENLTEQTRRLKLQVPEAKKAAKRNETVAE
jgi:hypothetical protein